MNDERPRHWRRAKELFLELFDRDPKEWPILLEQADLEDPSLRSEVESLLAHHQQASAARFLFDSARAAADRGRRPATDPAAETSAATGSTMASGRDRTPSRTEATFRVPPVNSPDERALVFGRRRLGEYDLVRKIGQGGMGTIYLATHVRLRRQVALKVMPPSWLVNPRTLARFQREMAAVGKLDHPNVVRALDAGDDHGIHFLTMEYVQGLDLATLVRQHGPMEVGAACEIVRQAANGLADAHRHGLIHRDVKPANLMLTRDGTVKILDLGLAKWIGQRSIDASSGGHLMGTLDYMAPEQAGAGHTVGPRADIYSLGCTLFHLICGEPPFSDIAADTPAAKILAHAQSPAPDVQTRRADVPADLKRLVARMLAKDPDARVASARVIAMEMVRCADRDALRRLANQIGPDDTTDEMSVSSATRCGPSAETSDNRHRRVRFRRAAYFGIGCCAALFALASIGPWLKDPTSSIRGERLQNTEGDRAMQLAHASSGQRLTAPFGDALPAEEQEPARPLDDDRHRVQALLDARALVTVAAGDRTFHLTGLFRKYELARNIGDGKVVRSWKQLKTEPGIADECLWIVGVDWTGRQMANDDALLLLSDLEHLARLDLENTRITDHGLTHVGTLMGLEFVHLGHTAITGRGLRELAGLKKLKTINLRGVRRVDDQGLERLGRLPLLVELMLSGTSVSDGGMIYLSRLGNLQRLDLENTHVSDRGAEALARLKQLRELSLGRTQVTDEALVTIGRLTELRELSLRNTTVSDAGMPLIHSLTKLEMLNLNDTHVTDHGMAVLEHMPALQTLRIAGTRFTDAGIPFITSCRQLNSLDLSRTGVTGAGLRLIADTEFPRLQTLRLGSLAIGQPDLDNFRRGCPQCKVKHRNGKAPPFRQRKQDNA